MSRCQEKIEIDIQVFYACACECVGERERERGREGDRERMRLKVKKRKRDLHLCICVSYVYKRSHYSLSPPMEEREKGKVHPGQGSVSCTCETHECCRSTYLEGISQNFLNCTLFIWRCEPKYTVTPRVVSPAADTVLESTVHMCMWGEPLPSVDIMRTDVRSPDERECLCR